MTITCDAIKCLYRQSKDGFVVSFVIHPQEMPVALSNADIGSQWRLTLVPLDNNGNAESEVMPTESGHRTVDKSTTETPPQSVKLPTGAKPWRDMPPAQQAGILANDKSFQKFIGARNSETAATWIRRTCGVISRSDIVAGDKSNDYLLDIIAKYRAWMREPEVVG